MRSRGMVLLGVVTLAAMSTGRTVRAVESAVRPELSGRWVMDEKASTMPGRPAGTVGRDGGPPGGGPPGGGLPRGGRGGAGGGMAGDRPRGAPPQGGPRGTPREFTLEQSAEQILLSERGKPFRVLLLTREQPVKALAPEGTSQSEAHWEGVALVIDDQTRGGAARKQTWRLDPKDPARLVVITRIAAEGERMALDIRQVFTRSAAVE